MRNPVLSDAERATLATGFEMEGLKPSTYSHYVRLVLRLPHHPALASATDLQAVINQAGKKEGRDAYRSKLRRAYVTMRRVGIVPEHHRPDEQLPEYVAAYAHTPEEWLPVRERMEHRYQARGWSRHTFLNDWSMLMRAGTPDTITTADLERVILTARKQGTRALYVARFRSIFQSLIDLGVVDAGNNPAAALASIRKPRSVPRPLTDAEAQILITEAAEPMRSWFVLGCYAGLRAMEVSGLRGADLEESEDGYVLTVRGKGYTELTIPAHPRVVEVIQAQGALGRLWAFNPNKVSSRASLEMQRLGVTKTFHACRHYFATSALRASGGDLLVVRDLMRHTSVATTQIYTQVEHGRGRSVLSQLA